MREEEKYFQCLLFTVILPDGCTKSLQGIAARQNASWYVTDAVLKIHT
jgi:hypothetical protein